MAALLSRQHFLATLPGQYELVEFIVGKDCYSHHFASWLDLRGLFASFHFMFAVDFAILELHKGFIWVELVDNITLKVCGSHRILDFVIPYYRFASYFVVLEYLVAGIRSFRYKTVSLQVATSRFATSQSRFATHRKLIRYKC